jgi:dipeptidyl aminopeptidase/acylaminoacyl peptidase
MKNAHLPAVRCIAAASAIFCLPETAGAQNAKRYTIEQFMKTTALEGVSFTHDDKGILFSSNESGIFNVRSVSVNGGKSVALTRSVKESTYSLEAFPSDGRFVYAADQGGNELAHIYVQDRSGREIDLTPGEKAKADYRKFHPNGKWFYFAWNNRDPKYFDLYKLHTGTLERERVFENTTGLDAHSISRDERWVALEKPNTTSDHDILLYDTKTRQIQNITQHSGVIANFAATFDPQSKYLYYRTNDGHEFLSLARYELATGKKEVVDKADWDILFCEFSNSGKYRVVGKNVDGVTEVSIYDEEAGKPLKLPTLPAGEIRNPTFSHNERMLGFYVNSDRSPSSLHVYDLKSGKVTKLVDGANPEIAAADLVEATVVRYKSFDGMAIPALLYKPKQASNMKKLPALIEVHGGPGGQSRKGYIGPYQYLVNQGYVILRVNNRGSSGYGKTFYTADDQKHGREPLRDCIEAKKYLQSLDYVDPDRIGIIGGSYGGYMTLAALAFHPEEFKVGVDIFGVSNWLRTLKNIPAWWEARRKALYAEMGDPDTQEDMLRAISPLFHADKIRRPLIVIQGVNDPRVVKAESDEIVAAVKKNRVPVEYVVFPNEGHGFTKVANQITAFKAISAFLDQYLAQ